MMKVKIAGLQKTSLIDYPDHLAAIIFTQGCNFYCPYCHNPSLVPGDNLEHDYYPLSYLFDFLRKRQGLLDGVVITGGEPTIQTGLKDLISKIKELGYKVKLDTNGTNPELLLELIEMKLIDYIAMDIKFPLKRYSLVSNQDNTEVIKKAVSIIMNQSIEYEFRTTVIPGFHKKEDIISISQLIEEADKYYIQNFRGKQTLDSELMGKNGFSPAKLKQFKTLAGKFIEKVYIRD